MDSNTNTNAPAAIPWWQSRILWAQIIAIVFGIASFFGLDLGAKLGMDETQTVAAIMTLIGIVTTVVRVVNPTPVVTATKTQAAAINASVPTNGSDFNANALSSSPPPSE